jgi:hypothetical protein
MASRTPSPSYNSLSSADDRALRLTAGLEALYGGFRPASSCHSDRAPASFPGC